MNKIAKVTVFFWIMKICATTLGETAGDLLSMTLNVGYALSSVILIVLFLISVIAQLKSTRVSSRSLLDCDPDDKYGGHNDVRFYGSNPGAWLCKRLADFDGLFAGGAGSLAFQRKDIIR